MIKSHRDLEVFQIAYHLSIDVHKTTEAFLKSELFGLTNQMRRASKGICANLAEGFMKQQFSKPDGVPLYPSEIIILFLTIIAPTFFRWQ